MKNSEIIKRKLAEIISASRPRRNPLGILKNKGFFKNPLFYLGFFSFILFGVLVFSFGNFFQNKENNSFIFSGNSKNSNFPENGLFLESANHFFQESPEISFFQNNSLIATTPPFMVTPQVFGALLEGGEAEPVPSKEIVEYIVKPGDNLSAIAAKFNVSLETVLWANDLNKNSIIKEGRKLIILPVSGVIHHVKKGDTLGEIARTYKGDIEKIIAFNELSGEGDIYIGDIIIVPEGKMPKTSNSASSSFIPLASSYFISPIASPYQITQGLHWYNAVDLSRGKCGEPIYAAAGGKVLKVKLTNSASPYAFGGAGNHLTILHPNGVVTFYGHIAGSRVAVGEEVSQGQIIALMGGRPGSPGAGRSTGCHLHFGVRGARNPFVK